MAENSVDHLVIGAGIVGVALGCRLKKAHRSFAILDAASGFGGVWRQYTYPGLRCDASFYSYCYSTRPWTGEEFADQKTILRYIEDEARENQLADFTHFSTRVVRVSWSSQTKKWSVSCDKGILYEAKFLYFCTGAFDQDTAYTPALKGLDTFKGPVIHPQFWPSHVELNNKHVVIVGGGATAVSLMGGLQSSASVKVLQRSKHFVYLNASPLHPPVPCTVQQSLEFRARMDPVYDAFLGVGPIDHADYHREVVEKLGTRIASNFDPLPRGRRPLHLEQSAVEALVSGHVEILTDTVEEITDCSIILTSGKVLPADVLITATGGHFMPLGKIELEVDNTKVHVQNAKVFLGVMLAGVPNAFIYIGGFNHTGLFDSWYLFVERVHDHMKKRLQSMCQPVFKPRKPTKHCEDLMSTLPPQALLTPIDRQDFIKRAAEHLQVWNIGRYIPWAQVVSSHHRDVFLKYDLEDGHIWFSV